MVVIRKRGKLMVQGRKSREEWEELVNNFIISGEKRKVYCQQKGISYSTFKSWYYKLRSVDGRTATTNNKADFVKLKIIAGSQGVVDSAGISKAEEKTGVKIILTNGIKLEITTGNIVQLIRQLNHVA